MGIDNEKGNIIMLTWNVYLSLPLRSLNINVLLHDTLFAGFAKGSGVIGIKKKLFFPILLHLSSPSSLETTPWWGCSLPVTLETAHFLITFQQGNPFT